MTNIRKGITVKFIRIEDFDNNLDSIPLTEEVLTEDKVVKFNGQTFPPYGWCVILCGGSGSGKSTVADLLIPINARKYDVDVLKSEKFYRIHSDGYDHVLEFRDGSSYVLEDEGLSEPFNLTNPAFVSWLHNKRRPVAKKLKQAIFNAGRDSAKGGTGRLPNILFDITGKERYDFESIISEVKEVGYKVAIVWVLAEIQQAIRQNDLRPRKVPQDMLISIHRNVMNTIENIALDKELFYMIDDFWVVLQTVFDATDADDVQRYVRLPNVFKIEKRGDVFKLPDEIKSAVEEQKKIIADMINEEE